MLKQWLAAALIASVPVLHAAPAHAVVVSITQARVNQGGVTPGDAPGFPVTISRSGSYRLDTNLDLPSGAAGKNGIEIRANDVTIDFNGFRLQGWLRGERGVEGKGFDTARIRNGIIAGFQWSGVEGRNFWAVEDMRILSNGGSGAHLREAGRVQRTTVSYNRAYGVYCADSCLVEGSVLSNNWWGIAMGSGTVLGNTISYSRLQGLAVLSGGFVGYGDNTLFQNNSGQNQVIGSVVSLQPNACSPACP